MAVLTWGNIRLSIQQSVPGISLDLIDEFLTTRYARILDHTRWLWLEASAYVQTVAAYTTGAVSVTNGSATITGDGTTWDQTAHNGRQFRLAADGPLYTFTWVSATEGTLDRVYEGEDETDAGYSLLRTSYALPDDFKSVMVVESPETGFPLTDLSTIGFSDSVGFRVQGTAEAFRIFNDAGTWKIELHGFPDSAKSYLIRYQKLAAGFNGSNTGESPLPIEDSGAAMMAGCRAEAHASVGDIPKATFFEGRFEVLLRAMVMADRRKRAREQFKPAQRFTRHRLERLMRNSTPRILG